MKPPPLYVGLIALSVQKVAALRQPYHRRAAIASRTSRKSRVQSSHALTVERLCDGDVESQMLYNPSSIAAVVASTVSTPELNGPALELLVCDKTVM